MNAIPTLVRAARPPFLTLIPVCILLATAVALREPGLNLTVPHLLLALLGGLAALVSVNSLNEYQDFTSGLDLHTRRTPFSGGSGALPAAPWAARAVFAQAAAALALTVAIGAWFLWQGVWQVIPLGLAGLAIIVTYTRHLNRHPWACLLAPGTGIGLVLIPATAFTLGANSSPGLWLASGLTFFVANNLLLLNQYPDIAADRAAGRYHFPIAYGVVASTRVYGAFVLAAAVTLLIGVVIDAFPPLALLALLPLAAGCFAWRGARTRGEHIGQSPRYLAANVATTLLTPLVLGVCLLV